MSELKDLLDNTIITAPNVKKEDIPFKFAMDAYSGTSFSPEIRAYREQLDYINHMNNVYANLSKQAKTNEQQSMLKDEFERYRQGYVRHQLDYLSAHSRVFSTMITGPSNFPTRTMEKRNQIVNNRLNEWVEYDKKAQKAIIKKLNPTMYGISSDRTDAIDLLKKELETKKKAHDIMIKANKIIRKKHNNPEDTINELQKIGLSEADAKELIKPGVFGGSGGYYSFSLANSNASIKRIEKRIKDLEKRKSQSTQEFDFDGGIVIDNVEKNRIQIKYDSKPSPEIIAKLKSRGFHWTPSLGVWQRMRSNSANYAVKEIVGKITKRQTEQDNPIEETKEEIIVMPKLEIEKEEEKKPILMLPEYKEKRLAIPDNKLSELRAINAKRKPVSISRDNKAQNKITIDHNNPLVNRWKKSPGSMDVLGVDTPPNVIHITKFNHKSKRKNKTTKHNDQENVSQIRSIR